jgi:hypothetical protein
MSSPFDNVSFESISDSLARVPDAINSISDVVSDPAANPVKATILLGIVVLFAMIVLVTVVMVFVRPRYEFAAADAGDGFVEDAAARPRKRRRRGVWGWVAAIMTVVSATVVGVAVLWLVTGATTASSSGCVGCHSTSVHSTAPLTDPHRDIDCVVCHEPGGELARVTSNLPMRVQHFVDGQFNPVKAATFGRTISSVGCRQCHLAALGVIGIDAARGLRVSHKEPLAAGAECIDCHRLQDGQVMARTVGMETCLRCHDGKQAKSGCAVCHDGDPAKAIVSKLPKTSIAGPLVPNPPCDVCHFDMTRCDNCHGLRMPHTPLFKTYGHARAGALNVWDNGGQLCGKCHYPGRRACTQEGCHMYKFPQHALSWKHDHQQAVWSRADSICRCHDWSSREHDGMNFCQICHPTLPPGARP